MKIEDGDGVTLYESKEWGGLKFCKQMSPPIRAEKTCAGVVIITNRKLHKCREIRYRNPSVVLWGGIGEKLSNGGTQWYLQDRIYDSNGIAQCICEVRPWYLERRHDDRRKN